VRVAPRRVAGEPMEWNPEAKTLTWKAKRNVLMAGGAYTKYYQVYKEEESRKAPHIRPIIVELRARRKLGKFFLRHLYRVQRECLGLPYTPPYGAVMHKQEEIPPLTDD